MKISITATITSWKGPTLPRRAPKVIKTAAAAISPSIRAKMLKLKVEKWVARRPAEKVVKQKEKEKMDAYLA